MNIQELTHQLIKEKSAELRKTGKIGEDFKVLQCLIKLPQKEKPVLTFNGDISWIMKSNTAHMKEGQWVYIWDLKKIFDVEFPKHKGLKVAYIFFFYTGIDYSIIFDFSPNSVQQEKISDYNHPGSKRLTDYYNLVFTELAMKQMNDKVRKELVENNYFITPSLIPYPINILAKPKVEINEFIDKLNAYFDSDLIEIIKNNWFKNKIFNGRKKALLEAIESYKGKKYHSCISVLIPQIEGILREFLYIKQNKTSKTNAQNAFKEIKKIFEDGNTPKVLNHIIDSFSEFFNSKKGFFESFNNWTDSLSNSFLSRHAYSHGKYYDKMYTKENSVRLFLILFTFFDMIEIIEGK